ncbi:MAG: outer membrane beta-barrel protein, partial [Bacteroidales bacterium]|nr:outer membrane beta-barrel protein [Bacteroidales bacterium]
IAEEAAEVEADAVVTVGNSAEPAAEEKSVQHVEVAESGRWDGPEVDSEQRQLRYRRPAVSVWGNAVNPAARGNGQFSGTLAGVDFNPGVGIIESGDLSYLPPVEFGLGLRFALSERWSIGLGADYSLLSRKFTGLFLDPHDLPVSYTSIVNTQHWLGARANIYYSILSSDKVDFYVRAGAGAQWCLANDYAMKNDSRSDNWSSKVDATQFTVGAGFGIQYALGRRVAIYLDPSLNYWFKNEEVPKSSRTVSPLGFGAELGLRFQL